MNEDKNNLDIKKIRKDAGFSLTDMAKIFDYKNVQSWANKESGSRKFNHVELEYFLLITGAHPTKKIVNINETSETSETSEKLSNEFIFNKLLFMFGIHKNIEFIQTIFLLGDLGYRPTMTQITKWRNPNKSTPLDTKTLLVFFDGMEKFKKITKDNEINLFKLNV